MKIVLEVTSFPQSKFIELLRNSIGENELIMLSKYPSWLEVNFEEFYGKTRVYGYDEFETYQNFYPDRAESNAILQLTHSILNDHQIMMLGDRASFRKKEGIGITHYSRLICKLTAAFLNFLTKEQPDCIYFRITPHNHQELVLAKVAEFLKVPVLVAEYSQLPWRQLLAVGYDKSRQYLDFPLKLTNSSTKEEGKLIERHFDALSSKYEAAIPVYERDRLKKSRGKFFSLRREIQRKWNWKRPYLFWNKIRTYKSYVKYSQDPDFSQPYIVFFLQYQPERSTLPEGFGFAQQLLAIEALRVATPDDIMIYVKEHPSTFTNRCDILHRNPSYYRDINDIEGVQLIQMEITPFELTDHSLVVCTTTGTNGKEALIRGKPVVYFGHTVYKEGYGIHKFDTVDKLTQFISESPRLQKDKIIVEAKKQILSTLKKSVPALDFNESSSKYEFYSDKYKDDAELKIVEYILLNGIEDVVIKV